MKVEHGTHICEHCGGKVPNAKVCPCCGREHSKEWIESATKFEGQMGLAVLSFLCVLSFNWIFQDSFILALLVSIQFVIGCFTVACVLGAIYIVYEIIKAIFTKNDKKHQVAVDNRIDPSV